MALIHSIKLENQPITGLVNWQDAEVVAQWNDGAVQANVDFSNVEFVNEAAQFIRQWIADAATGGTTGITEAPKFEMQVQDDIGNNYVTFQGCLDLVSNYIELSPVRIKCSITRLQEKQSLIERARGTTYYSLFDQNLISSSDYASIDYVVEKQFDFVELAMLSIATFLMLDKLASIIKEFGKDGAQTVALAAVIPGGAVGSIILAILIALLNLAYAFLLILYIIDLIIDIMSFVISPVREFKGMNLKLMAEKAADYLGYQYESSIDELNGDTQVYYLPSKAQQAPFSAQFINVLSGNQQQGTADDGLPNAQDYGNTFEETLLTINNLFNAELKIDESTNKVYQESLINDTFWKRDANFIFPSVLNETVSYRTDLLQSRKFYTFQKDDVDNFTTTELEGRSIEVVTSQTNVNDQRCVRIKGFKEINFGHALGARKDELSGLEKAVKALAGVADGVINFFGGSSNLAGNIQSRVGMLKISQNFTTIPKLLYLRQTSNGLRIPLNHKATFGAEALEGKYYINDSFVRQLNANQPPRGQRQKIHPDGLEIPLGFSQFLDLVNNSYCSYRGQDAKIEELRYRPAKDRAIVNGWFYKQYAFNLEEIFYLSDEVNP